MTDIDTIADGLASQIAGAYLVDEVTFLERHAAAIRVVKSALQSYGDACAKQMRDDAAKCCMDYSPQSDVGYLILSAREEASEEIRALPLPSEKVKP